MCMVCMFMCSVIVYSPIRLRPTLTIVPEELFTLVFETESLVDSDLTQYARLGSACLCLPGAEITSTHATTSKLFMWASRIKVKFYICKADTYQLSSQPQKCRVLKHSSLCKV